MSLGRKLQKWRDRVRDDRVVRLILGGGLTSLSVRVAGLALGFVSHVMLARMLGAGNYGLYAIAMGWCLILVVPAKLGLDHTALRYASVYVDEGRFSALRKLLAFSTIVILVTTAAVGTLAIALLMIDSGVLGVGTLKDTAWFTLLIGTLALLGVFSAFYRAAHRIFLSQFFEQVLRSLLLIALLALAYAAGGGLTFSHAIEITALSSIFALAAMILGLRTLLSGDRGISHESSEWRFWLGLSWPMLLLALSQQVLAQVNLILLGSFTTGEEAGHYSAAARLAAFVPFALVAVNSISAPMIAAAYRRNDTEEMRRIARVSARVSFISALIVSAVFVAVGHRLLNAFGVGFESSYPILIILLLGGLVNAATGSVGFFLTMTGQQNAALLSVVAALAINLLLSAFLLPPLRTIGAAVAAATGIVAMNAIQLFIVRRKMGIDTSVFNFQPTKVEPS